MSNANYRSQSSQSTTAIVTGTVQVKDTQFGAKAVLDFTLPNNTVVSVWDTLDENNESILFELAKGQEVPLYVNVNGNWKVDKKGLTKKSTKPALAVVAAKEPLARDNSNLVRQQAKLLRDCVDAVLIEFNGINLSDDVIQKYATTLYISLNKN